MRSLPLEQFNKPKRFCFLSRFFSCPLLHLLCLQFNSRLKHAQQFSTSIGSCQSILFISRRFDIFVLRFQWECVYFYPHLYIQSVDRSFTFVFHIEQKHKNKRKKKKKKKMANGNWIGDCATSILVSIDRMIDNNSKPKSIDFSLLCFCIAIPSIRIQLISCSLSLYDSK